MKISTKDKILVSLFAALTSIGAFIRIPIPYVPFTLQFCFTAFAGLLLGAKLGMLSQVLYVAVGLAGLPVFTKGGGISYIFQPTFGYLIGFIVAAYVIGKMTESSKELTFKRAITAVITGLFFVYLLGVPYLYIAFKFYLNNPKSIMWAVNIGFTTCIAGDLVLSTLVSMTASKVVKRLRKAGLVVSLNNN